MFFFAVVVLGTAIKLAKEHKKGQKKLKERLVHSRKSMNLPRNFAGIPRAFSEKSDSIFTVTSTKSLETFESTRSMDDESVASEASENEGIWC
jgi:hypothetical protein